MDENRFWSIIESAWQTAGGSSKARQKLADGKLPESDAEALVELLEEDVIPALHEQLDQLSAAELLAFDRTLERILYDLDRAEIQEHTDGSDDGFLYARGFVVAAGKAYWEAVKANPSLAMADLECEEMCYISFHLHEEKFGEVPPSGISRESCSNKGGWPELS